MNIYLNNKRKVPAIYLVYILFCAVSVLIVGFSKEDHDGLYSYMWILPLIHTLVFLFLYDLFSDLSNHLIRAVLIAGYTIRNIIAPLLICLADYQISTVQVTADSSITKAALLMSYETAAVFFFMRYRLAVESRKIHSLHLQEIRQKEFRPHTLFNLVNLGITAVMVLTLILVPSVTDAYQNMWTADTSVIIQQFSTIQDYDAGSLDRLLYAFFLMFFSVMQIIWSIYAIAFIRRKIGNTLFSLLLSYGVLFLNTMFVSETSAYTVFVLVLLIIYIGTLYPNRKKAMYFLAGVGILAVLSSMIMARANTYQAGDSNLLSKLATFSNAYFPGIANVSNIFKVRTPNPLITLYRDIYSSIPLQSLIPALYDGERLSIYFNYYSGTTVEILPLIGQAYYYLNILAPLVPMTVVYFALKWEAAAKYTDNYIFYMAAMTSGLVLAAGCTMYDLTILLAFTFKTIIPFFIFAKLTSVKVRWTTR